MMFHIHINLVDLKGIVLNTCFEFGFNFFSIVEIKFSLKILPLDI